MLLLVSMRVPLLVSVHVLLLLVVAVCVRVPA